MISSIAVQPARTALMKVVLCLWLGLSLSVGMNAQGWIRAFEAPSEDYGSALIQTADQGFLIAGFTESFGVPGQNQTFEFYLLRTDVDGSFLWQRVYDSGFEVDDYAFGLLQAGDGGFLVVGESVLPTGRAVMLLKVNQDGEEEWIRHYLTGSTGASGNDIIPAVEGEGYLITGYVIDADGNQDAFLLRIDAQGNELWTSAYGSPDLNETARSVIAYQGGYAFTGITEDLSGNESGNDIILYRVDSNGEVIWNEFYLTPENDEARDLLATSDGNLALTGETGNNSDALLLKYDADGALLTPDPITIDFGEGDGGNVIAELPNGDLVIGGFTEVGQASLNTLLARVTPGGVVDWSRSLGEANGKIMAVEDLVVTADGGFAMAGYDSEMIFEANDLILIKTDGQGNVQSNYITGRAFHDKPGGDPCEFDQFDEPLGEWIVAAEGANGTFFGTTDANGRYSILVDTGEYTVSVFPVSNYWSVCPDIDNTVSMSVFYDTVAVDFPIEIETECPYMEVDVSTPFLTICSDVEYTVSYCNLGTAAAIGAEVRVTLDEELTFLSADLPFEQDGNVFTFQLGNVASTACGSFRIQTAMACNGIASGQAGMVTAEIFPDTVCVEPSPDWDGSSVIVSGECQADTLVRFEIRNVGQGEMEEPKLYFIVEDEILLEQDTFLLDPDSTKQISLPVTGATYRIIAQQSDFHPGMSSPTVAIEGCTNDGEYTTGHFIKFPENDRDPAIAIDVQEAVGSPNAPIELRGYPKGYGEESFIDDSTDITYIIFFSNTGTDTIDRVTIRDTLPAGLDLRTLQLGASSHPYTFRAYDGGILKFTFSDIQLLPGSSADETGSYGYVKFKLSQKLDNPEGTVIRNSAAIFFENQVPRQSNVVRHTVGRFPDFVDSTTVSSQEVFLPGVEIKIAPNPFIESTMFEIEGVTLERVDFQLYDTAGRLVRKENFRGNKFEFQRGGLNSGLYFYSLWSQGRLLNTGKVLVR